MLVAIPVVSQWGFAQRPGETIVDSLVVDTTPEGAIIQIRTSTAFAPFTCRLPSGRAREAVIDFPRARSRLQPLYTPDNPLIREARVEEDIEGRDGVRIRISLDGAKLSGVEQKGYGLILRLVKAERPPGAAPRSEEPAVVGVGDKLEISVFGHEGYSQVAEVRADGTVDYPPLGEFHVAGKTVEEIDEEITRVLDGDYVKDPQVSIRVSQWITIMGEVRAPGRYALKPRMRLLDLLAEAGGATKEAGPEILITRQDQTSSGGNRIVVDREELLGREGDAANVPLRSGDIVTLQGKRVFYVQGEVSRPGPYFLERDMTLLKALAAAGGFGQFANRKEVRILRTNAARGKDSLVVNIKKIQEGKREDVPIRPDDIVIVPRRLF